VDYIAALTNQTSPPNLANARAVFESMLASTVTDSVAIGTIQKLVQGHGFEFSVDDVRRVAFSICSPEVLKHVVCSAPQVQLRGIEIFDRRYPGLVLSQRLKLCVKILLARGAQLGKASPASKLLRKLEVDTNHAWAQRYFTSLTRAGMHVPDHVQQRVLAYLQ